MNSATSGTYLVSFISIPSLVVNLSAIDVTTEPCKA